MTIDQLDQIEAALGFPLPEAYRRVALRPPFRSTSSLGVYWFFDDPDAVVHATQHPLEEGDYQGINWRDGMLTIGDGPGGDPLVLDTRDANLPVYYLSHETHEFDPGWLSFDAFVREWAELPNRIEAERAAGRTSARAWRRRAATIIIVFLLAAVLLPLGLLTLIVWSNERRRRRRGGAQPP